MNALYPVERGGRVRQLADAVVERALAFAHTAEVEAKRRETAPDEGHGARKLKSYMFAGGAIEMKPLISGRRIKSCMPIQAPKLTPATQVVSASG